MILADELTGPIYVTILIGCITPIILALIATHRGTQAKVISTSNEEKIGRLEERLKFAEQKQAEADKKLEEMTVREDECRQLIQEIIERGAKY